MNDDDFLIIKALDPGDDVVDDVLRDAFLDDAILIGHACLAVLEQVVQAWVGLDEVIALAGMTSRMALRHISQGT